MNSLRSLYDESVQQVWPETSFVLRENGMKLQTQENNKKKTVNSRERWQSKVNKNCSERWHMCFSVNRRECLSMYSVPGPSLPPGSFHKPHWVVSSSTLWPLASASVTMETHLMPGNKCYNNSPHVKTAAARAGAGCAFSQLLSCARKQQKNH